MTMKNKYVMFMHGGSGNHGCEALVRTTAAIFGGPDGVQLWSKAKQQDYRYGADKSVDKIVAMEGFRRFSLEYFIFQFRSRILHDINAERTGFIHRNFKNKVAVSIGGDNYCYPWSAKECAEVDREIRKCGKATILWGCSIDEEFVTPEVLEDLRQFDLITAREQLSYQYLKTINPNTIQVTDPAFLLDSVEKELPDGFQEKNTVGINISPLIMEYSSGDVILKNYRNLISYILSNTKMNICLIPHVVWEAVSDQKIIDLLYEEFASTGRVCKIEDDSCTVLKGYIARCRFFIGARTHATIAAYSSCVPTLVAGYSVKSKGIALDIFGTYQNYVVPVQELKDDTEMTSAFCWLMEHEAEIREHLRNVIPGYKEKAVVDIQACLGSSMEK